MNMQKNKKTLLGTLKRTALGVLIIWTLSIGASLNHNINHEIDGIKDILYTQAKITLRNNLDYRNWAAFHGGVYVPVTESTQPNPYLNIPQRDIETTAGIKLTLINPAYMARQVFEISKKNNQVKENIINKITSLNPLNPINTADEWETKSLQQFSKGVKEALEYTTKGETKYLSFMKPFITAKGCIKCHPSYKEGDIRGGIRIDVPVKPFQEHQYKEIRDTIMSHLLLLFLGYGIGFLAHRKFAENICEKEILQSELELLATTDALTGIPNRRAFLQKTENQIERTKRSGSAFSFIFMDVDNFKNVNDKYGHPIGDKYLQTLAEIIDSTKRNIDPAGRIGGDEFGLLLPETGAEEASILGKRIQDKLEKTLIPTPEGPITISVSMGISVYQEGYTLERLKSEVDKALYAAKDGKKRTDIE